MGEHGTDEESAIVDHFELCSYEQKCLAYVCIEVKSTSTSIIQGLKQTYAVQVLMGSH
jgi:hypothetical protein